MASEFATENGHKIARLLKYYEGPPYNIPELLDAELQEVREVLEAIQTNRYGDGCWCDVEVRRGPQNADRHTEACQRARDLMEKLKP